jgi:SSS family solute:Na+ symporter
VTLLHSGLKYIGILVILGVALHMTGGVSPMITQVARFADAALLVEAIA